jgi:hypothetical protein
VNADIFSQNKYSVWISTQNPGFISGETRLVYMWRFDADVATGTWTAVASPVSVTLHGVARTADGACAVGETGVVLGRAADGEWGVVVENGPSARGETLYCVAATADGERVWFAGANGALGYYDLPEGNRYDRSEPSGVENAFHGIGVAGPRGSEKILVSDGSGNALPGEVSSDGVSWDRQRKPAGGTALTAIDADSDGVGYAVDSNANVWQTTAEGWRNIGVADAQNSFYAVVAGTDAVVVGGGNGRVYELRRPSGEDGNGAGDGDGAGDGSGDGDEGVARSEDVDGRSWTPYTLGSETVEALATDGEEAVAGGTSGSIHYRRGDSDWASVEWSGTKTLRGVAVGDPCVAVGNNGTIVERAEGGRENDS